jgi:hypothetical protein
MQAIKLATIALGLILAFGVHGQQAHYTTKSGILTG